MLLLIIIPVLVIVFLATRYGVKSDAKNIRIISYFGIFLSIMALTLLGFLYVLDGTGN